MIHIIGLGEDGYLRPELQGLLERAPLVVAASAILDALEVPHLRRLPLKHDLAALAVRIHEACAHGHEVVVMAHGDPLLFGLGASLMPHLGHLPCAIHPAPSSLQLLAARLKTPWHDWRIVSVHGREKIAPLLAAITHATQTLVFTDPQKDPAWIGRLLLERGAGGHFSLVVAECLGQAQERITTIRPDQAAASTFQHPNLVLVRRQDSAPKTPLEETTLVHDGTFSKLATRATALALLAPGPDAVFWDAGAGSGIVALEAAARIGHGMVFALEANPRRCTAIAANRARARAWMVEIVPGPMAETAPGLPAPSHVFWGGGMSPANLEVLATALTPGGRILASFVRLEVLEMLRTHAPRLGLSLAIHHIQHSVGEPLAGGTRLVPHNPVFLALMEKRGGRSS